MMESEKDDAKGQANEYIKLDFRFPQFFLRVYFSFDPKYYTLLESYDNIYNTYFR